MWRNVFFFPVGTNYFRSFRLVRDIAQLFLLKHFIIKFQIYYLIWLLLVPKRVTIPTLATAIFITSAQEEVN